MDLKIHHHVEYHTSAPATKKQGNGHKNKVKKEKELLNSGTWIDQQCALENWQFLSVKGFLTNL